MTVRLMPRVVAVAALVVVVSTGCGPMERTAAEGVSDMQDTVGELLDRLTLGSTWDLNELTYLEPCYGKPEKVEYSMMIVIDESELPLPADIAEVVRQFWAERAAEPERFYGPGFGVTVRYEGAVYTVLVHDLDQRRVVRIDAIGDCLPPE